MVNMAKIAWGFELSADLEAVDVDINTAYSDGFLIAPKKFPILITPRSDKHKDIITKEYEATEPFFMKYNVTDTADLRTPELCSGGQELPALKSSSGHPS